MKIYKDILRFLKKNWIIMLILAAYIIVSTMLDAVICPFRRITGLPCPACGITRAYIALIHLDIKAAFLYNPMFLVIPPGAFYMLFGKKPLLGTVKRERIFLIAFSSVVFLFWFARLYQTLTA